LQLFDSNKILGIENNFNVLFIIEKQLTFEYLKVQFKIRKDDMRPEGTSYSSPMATPWVNLNSAHQGPEREAQITHFICLPQNKKAEMKHSSFC
jgi:hypothetical protein